MRRNEAGATAPKEEVDRGDGAEGGGDRQEWEGGGRGRRSTEQIRGGAGRMETAGLGFGQTGKGQ